MPTPPRSNSASGLRSEQSQLQDDVNSIQKDQQDQGSADRLTSQSSVDSLEKQVGSDTSAEQDFATKQQVDQLDQQVKELSDTVDQLQRDLESAAGGGGGTP